MITFREFMELALYYPVHGGYYTDPGTRAAKDDYYTSPAAHPAFGAAIAIQLRSMWWALDRPQPFSAVELGAGDGLLARDVVAYAARLDGPFAGALRYVTVERDERAPTDVTGCVLSNELVDAMPVARFQVEEGQVAEVFVTVDADGSLGERLGEPVTPAIGEILATIGRELPDGFRGEVNDGIRPWMEGVEKILSRGFVLTIDYGGTSQEIYAREKGTLQTYFRHVDGLSPYQNVGRQDMTAHVDFTSVEAEGARVGLRPIGLMTQRRMLRRCGIDRIEAQLREIGLAESVLAANLHGLGKLTRPDGLGGFRVLFQERATGVGTVEQILASDEELAHLPAPPVLGPGHINLREGGYPPSSFEMDTLWPIDPDR
jgi:SAM-dependent MidA family methyltransferase